MSLTMKLYDVLARAGGGGSVVWASNDPKLGPLGSVGSNPKLKVTELSLAKFGISYISSPSTGVRPVVFPGCPTSTWKALNPSKLAEGSAWITIQGAPLTLKKGNPDAEGAVQPLKLLFGEN